MRRWCRITFDRKPLFPRAVVPCAVLACPVAATLPRSSLPSCICLYFLSPFSSLSSFLSPLSSPSPLSPLPLCWLAAARRRLSSQLIALVRRYANLASNFNNEFAMANQACVGAFSECRNDGTAAMCEQQCTNSYAQYQASCATEGKGSVCDFEHQLWYDNKHVVQHTYECKSLGRLERATLP